MVELNDSPRHINGLLESISSTNGTSRSITYDALDRPMTVTETVGTKTFSRNLNYDSQTGKVDNIIYQSNSSSLAKLSYIYNSNHYLSETRLNDITTIWKLTDVNNLGQPTAEELGGGLYDLTHAYDAYGIPTDITYKLGNTTLDHLQLDFDVPTGNLESRLMNGITENFTYDNLNRLSTYGKNGYTPVTVNYSSMGNITGKSDVGSLFEYTLTSNPYALTYVTPNTSNPIPMRLQDITYTSFNKPATIEENTYTATLTYNDASQRAKMVITQGGSSFLTRYYFGEYESEEGVSTSKEMLYLGGDAYTAPAVYMKQNTGTWQLYYLIRDYQGSITGILDNSGNRIATYSYDPWGRMRNPSTLVCYNVGSEPALLLNRGYTGHEHLAMFGIINMNGRLYDPCLGRFLNVDNFVQDPGNSQNLNRYSYCLNNPLKYTDPDGEFFWLLPILGAAIFGTGNLIAHAIRGDIHNAGDAFKFFGQGALAGGVIGAGLGLGLQVPFLRSLINIGGFVYKWSTIASTIGGLAKGIIAGDWSGLANAGKILVGKYYLDENNFLGGVWQGISRHTYEYVQTDLGYTFSQVRNAFGAVDNVDYFGGATLVNHNNQNVLPGGMTLGNFILGTNLEASIDDWTFMHEYGHTIQSRVFGPLYALFIAPLSGIDYWPFDFGSQPWKENPLFFNHDIRWYETEANRLASNYFKLHYNVNWDDRINPRSKILAKYLTLNSVYYYGHR